MGRLILIRHAESEGNRAQCFTPHPEIPLTDVGRAQALDAAAVLAARFAPTRIVSSPYLRARQTADILGGHLGLAVEVHDDLRERSYGELAGSPYSTPRPGYDKSRYWTWRPPGGETLDEVVQRAGAALDGLVATAPDDEIVVVSHGAVMMALERHVRGAWGPGTVVRNTGMLIAEHAAGAWTGLAPLEFEASA
ncbi:MAG TPA: histidine phosphatase family protein [Candidatus Binatia bacterium]|jgi:probable phosphoglycerate mutase|nr:histidine phosphatase family protein [Candidatus Binatia bacterium]